MGLFVNNKRTKLEKTMTRNYILVIALIILQCLIFSEDALAAEKNSSLKQGRTFLKFEKNTDKAKLSSEVIINKAASPFTLAQEDVIKILVWDNPELTTVLPVRPDGFISFPLIGDIKAQGLTPDQLRVKLAVKLSKFVRKPNVTVMIQEINSIQISITGEINEPGSFKVNRPITLLHLISKAKGVTDKADMKRSFVLREGKKLDIDMYALIKKDDFSQNIWLKPNDLVVVRDNFQSRINIIGEITAPQIIDYREGMTVLDSVLLAGGLTEIAKPQDAKVYRKYRKSNGANSIKIIAVDLEEVIFKGDLSKNVLLRPGDIIHIPRSFF
jgi:polysaccharide export outer membrane protein